VTSAGPGDVVEVRNGTYDDCPVTIAGRDGTAEREITLRAETIGGVVFSGEHSVLKVEVDHWVVEGFVWDEIVTQVSSDNFHDIVVSFEGATDDTFRHNVIRRSGPPRAQCPAEGGRGVLRLSSRSKRNLITRNDFIDFPCAGIKVICNRSDCGSTHNVLSYNYFSDSVNNGRENEGEGEQIQFGQGARIKSQYSIVEHNLFERVSPSAELISDKTHDNIYRYNTFRQVDDYLTLRSVHRTVVHDNWFLSSKGVRIRGFEHEIRNNYFEESSGIAIKILGGETDYKSKNPTSNRILFRNNSILYGDMGAIQLGQGWPAPPTDLRFENNLLINDVEMAIEVEAEQGTQWVDNVVWSTGSGQPGSIPSAGVVVTGLNLQRDSTGAWASSTYPDIGAQPGCRPLKRADVGAGSSYTCDPDASQPNQASGAGSSSTPPPPSDLKLTIE